MPTKNFEFCRIFMVSVVLLIDSPVIDSPPRYINHREVKNTPGSRPKKIGVLILQGAKYRVLGNSNLKKNSSDAGTKLARCIHYWGVVLETAKSFYEFLRERHKLLREESFRKLTVVTFSTEMFAKAKSKNLSGPVYSGQEKLFDGKGRQKSRNAVPLRLIFHRRRKLLVTFIP
jgi:hypothetical protein